MALEYRDESDRNEILDHREDPSAILHRVPYYTYILLACIGAVFLTQLLTSHDPDVILIDRVSAYYAGFDKQAFLKGDYWRLFTGTLIHSGFPHVLMNCYALYIFGRLIELLSNRAHVAIVFVLSALGGDLLSLVFNPEVTSVGASGGIVGFLSYLAVYAFKRRQFTSREFRKSLLINIGFLLIFGFVLYNVVDNYGHIGGLIVGGIYAFLQVPSDAYTDPREAKPVTRYFGTASMVLYVLTAILSVLLLVSNRQLPDA
jgi:rhomboid protease GluP